MRKQAQISTYITQIDEFFLSRYWSADKQEILFKSMLPVYLHKTSHQLRIQYQPPLRLLNLTA